MFNVRLKPSVAALAVVAGLLVSAGPASAAILYSGHAGLGSSVYQHNQTDLEFASSHVTDGTSNTLETALLAKS